MEASAEHVLFVKLSTFEPYKSKKGPIGVPPFQYDSEANITEEVFKLLGPSINTYWSWNILKDTFIGGDVGQILWQREGMIYTDQTFSR